MRSKERASTLPIGIIPEDLFVGRHELIEHLEGVLQCTTEERGRLVMLVGEPGIGKTRLAEQLCERAKARGLQVLWGWCQEEPSSPPDWAWELAIRPYLQGLKPRGRSEQLTGSAPLVALAFPSIAGLLPGLKPYQGVETSPDQLRLRLFDAISSFLMRASSDKPMLIVLDDLHWADEGTLKLLAYVARQLKQTHLLILGIYRDVEVRRTHPLAGVLGELSRERLFERHALKGLSEEEVQAFCAAALPADSARMFAGRVHEMSDGNPLFVSELVRTIAAEGLSSPGYSLQAGGRAARP